MHEPWTKAALSLISHLDLAAASGIAQRADRLYVIADDQLELAVYDLRGQRQGSIALLPGALPTAHTARKARKPDFEALIQLSEDALLALGSGSTPQRMRGVWIQFGGSALTTQVIDLSELYDALAAGLPELNIEGGAVLGPHLYLCSRGNGARRDNALLQLDLSRVLESLRGGHALTARCLLAVQAVGLGELDGTALSLTDLAVERDGLVFCAAAEASANTYDDGACAGSVIGRLSAQGGTSDLVLLEPRVKIEGLCATGASEWLAVADADDPGAQAPLFSLSPWQD
jgi:hypothetical protein